MLATSLTCNSRSKAKYIVLLLIALQLVRGSLDDDQENKMIEIDQNSQPGFVLASLSSLNETSALVFGVIACSEEENEDLLSLGGTDVSDCFDVDDQKNLVLSKSLAGLNSFQILLEVFSRDFRLLATLGLNVTDGGRRSRRKGRFRDDETTEIASDNCFDAVARSRRLSQTNNKNDDRPSEKPKLRLQRIESDDDDARRERLTLHRRSDGFPPVAGRQRRSVRPVKIIDIPETNTDVLLSLENDYSERFAFKDPAPARLEINPVLGSIRLKEGHRLDYETEPEIRLTVVITRVDSSSYYDEQPILIRVLDENDEIPQFRNVPYPFLGMVSTSAAPGTSVFQLMVQDADSDSLIRYNLESGGEDRFNVDPETGVVRTKGAQSFPLGKEYEIGISAQDLRAPTLQKSSTQSLKILVGEREPQFFKTQYVTTVPETAEKQFEVVEIKALSHHGYPITYELTTESGGQSNEFAIDQRTGVVDLLRKLDYEKDAHQYHLKVKAIENRRSASTSTINLVVNLIDMNDNAPTFPLSQYIVQGIAETVPIGTNIIEVVATDLDSLSNSQLTYSVSDANFTVHTINSIGHIKTARRLDYDAIPDHTYNFTVTATDNGSPPLRGSANVRVSVTNVNDENPVFMQTLEYVQLSEDAAIGTVIHVVQAHDPDGDDVAYSFSGGGSHNGRPFSIDSNSGIITLVGALDKSRVSYRLNITATDNGQCCGGATSRSSQGLVVVEIKDINNNAPKFTDCASYAPVVLEKENVGTFVIQVTALDSDTGPNGNVTYSLVKSTDQGVERFDIDQFNGIVSTADVFDREAKIGVTDFGVTVKAEDHGSPTLAGFCTFRIKIGDKNDNPPIFNLHEYSASIEESSPIGRRVKQVYATDRDAGENSKVEYFIRRDTSGFFALNPSSGWVTVAKPMTGQRKVTLEIEARDRGEPPKRSEVRMEIEITQTTNEYPNWAEDYSATTIRISENAPVNFPVKRFRARSTVPDSSLNIFISPGDTPEQNGEPISFYSRMDDATNEMILMTYRPLDYETLSKYTLTIKAANRAVSPLHIDMQVNIELIDENDEIPQFIGLDENGRYPGSIVENLEPGTEVITVTATDKDEFPAFKTISYRIKDVGEDFGKFTIDGKTGKIRTRMSFDREMKNEYYITVLALDGAPSNRTNHHPPGTPNQGEAEVQIRVTDTNDNAPFFKDGAYTARVPENTDIGTVIMAVTAEDSDEENSLTYSITDGNKGSAFEVVPDLGEIRVRGHLDYETGPREYRMKFRVFDDKFANFTTLIVQILDVNDNPPKFDSAIYSVLDLTEEEQGISKSSPKYLLTVRALDPDIDRRSSIKYGLTGQFADDGTFIINEHTGEIFLTRSLDRDAPHGRPMWNFNVLAHDEVDSSNQPSLTGYSEVRVQPKDINDNAPVFDRSRLIGAVPEHSRAGMTVLTVSAADADNGINGTVVYSLTKVPRKSGQPVFSIDANTGLISTVLSDVLDREVEAEYEIVVEAKDKGMPAMSSTATVKIIIDDINDHAPKFMQPIYRATMSENLPSGASITSVSATDRDIGANAKLMYSLKQHDREYFTIASIDATNTGVLKVHRPVDFDSLLNPTFNLTVYVEDTNTTHVDTAYVEVLVIDYNDNAPVFIPNQQRVTVYENVTVGTTLYRFSATDRDTGFNRQFTYSVDRATDPDKKFSINSDGLITTAKSLDRETKSDHRVHILAIDKGIPPQTGTGTLFVMLNDVNDNFPEFACDYRPVIYENQPPGRTVIEVSAIDRDTASNGPPFEFWLPCNGNCPCVANPTCGHFAFRYVRGGGENGHGSGVVTSLRTFDREKQKEYLMPIVIRDSGNPSVSGTNTLTIIIGDVNDDKHYSGHKDIFVYNYKGIFDDAFLGSVFAEDEDDWDIDNKTFTFELEETAHRFRLDRNLGHLYMNGRVSSGIYEFKVKVYDSVWKREVTSSVKVNVKDIPEEAIVSSGSVRLQGATAEEFISNPKQTTSSRETGSLKSMYETLRDHIATKLGVPVENVDIFTVCNHPIHPRTIDVRYSAHGSPFYRPVKLDGRLMKDRNEIEKSLGLTIVMSPVDECREEICENDGCTNAMVITNDPLVTNTNRTSMVGVTSYVEARCVCDARTFASDLDTRCHAQSCHNGGTCHQLQTGFRCDCLAGFDGPRCQQTRKSFSGSAAWAWYKPLAHCKESHTSVEFIAKKEDGLILYEGPMETQPTAAKDQPEPEDFILLELRNGYPLLRINLGSGESKLTVDGRDRQGQVRVERLNDGQWHRIDIIISGKKVRLIVDRCDSAVVNENENSGTSFVDSRACEANGETPGENQFLNVNQPLQLGGRMNSWATYPANALKEGFQGCLKNLVHNGELYDLHSGRVGEQMNSIDGCPDEDASCGTDEHHPQKTMNCGINGTCVGDFSGNFRCVCRPGWRGPKCSIPTTTKDFREDSFIEWNLQDLFFAEMNRRLRATQLQMMFRTRQNVGIIFDAQNVQKSEYVVLEIVSSRIRFRYNIGSGDQDLILSYVNASDGEWHAVSVDRVGQWVVLTVDSGEGRYFNESFGLPGGHVEMKISQRGLFAGGYVRFPSANSQPLVDYDFNNGCINDVRLNGDWLPMDQSQNKESHAAEYSPRSQNIEDGCVSDICVSGDITCPAELFCVDLWRYSECRCPLGHRLLPSFVSGGATCLAINECNEQPNICRNGICYDLEDGYACECNTGYGGPTCAERREQAAAFVSTGALLIIIFCVILLLLLILIFIVYTRRRRVRKYPEMVNVDDDDVRENIIYYDEEGVGEQDQNAYDISQLRKPADEPYRGHHQRERIVTPPMMEKIQPHLRYGENGAGVQPDVRDFINDRLREVDDDPNQPPYESVREYAYEGEGSTAGSLSSLASVSDDGDLNLDYLNDWGPRFHQLADMYSGGTEMR